MSASEIIGIASGIISFLNACVQLIQAAEDASGLPPSLRAAATRLPLIQDSFWQAKRSLETEGAELSEESYRALKTVLSASEARAGALSDILGTAMPLGGTSRTKKYFKALVAFSKADEVETLMNEMTQDLQALVANHIIRGATGKHIEQLLSKTKPKGREGNGSVMLYNNGAGNQNVFTGVGNQNVLSEGAIQVNAPAHGATFNFVSK